MRIIAALALIACLISPAWAQQDDGAMLPGVGPMGQICFPMVPGCGPMGGGPGGGTIAPATQVPTIAGLSPNNGPTAGGTTVIITGTQFIGLSGAGAVVFGANNAASYIVLSPTSISAVSPAGLAATVDVRVTNPIGQSLIVAQDQYTYTASGCGPGSADFTTPCNNVYFAAVN